MNILSYLYLLCALLFFESAITVRRLHREAALNRTGASALFLMSMYSLVYGLFFVASSASEAAILFRILWTLTFFAVAVMLHFCLILARLDRLARSVPFIWFMYLVPALLCLALVTDSLGSFDFRQTRWGWDGVDRQPAGLSASFPYFYMLAYSLAGFASIFVRGHTMKDPTERKQVLAITGFTTMSFACIAIPYLSFVFAGAALDRIDAILWSNLGVITFLLIWLTGLRYTMKKYRLLILLPDEPVEHVFRAMETGMAMMDHENTVIFANAEAAALFAATGGPPVDLRGRVFHELFRDRGAVIDAVESLRKRVTRQVSCAAVPSGTPRSLEMSMYPMFNGTDQYIGSIVIVLAMDRSDRAAEFQARFTISEREKEITLLIVSGLSNKEIAERLFISSGTVKNHVYNIYEKTGARNRVELTRLLDQA